MANSANLFTFDWDADVSAAERERLFKGVISLVRRWRLEMPAVLFLEINAPLASLAGQSAIVFSPFLAPLFRDGIGDVQRIAKLLRDRENVHRLIHRITEGEDNDAARK